MLFGKDPGKYYPGIKVKIGKFGKSDDDLQLEVVEEGNLFYLLRECYSSIKYEVFKNPIEFEGLQRIEKGEYPVAAIRESVIECVDTQAILFGNTDTN
ncbi:MAG: hypothetical protein U5K00_02170 [Melioribacteraceae bacterium]|nr:hypothetical protein [Melioribacteraceae bacterium]